MATAGTTARPDCSCGRRVGARYLHVSGITDSSPRPRAPGPFKRVVRRRLKARPLASRAPHEAQGVRIGGLPPQEIDAEKAGGWETPTSSGSWNCDTVIASCLNFSRPGTAPAGDATFRFTPRQARDFSRSWPPPAITRRAARVERIRRDLAGGRQAHSQPWGADQDVHCHFPRTPYPLRWRSNGRAIAGQILTTIGLIRYRLCPTLASAGQEAHIVDTRRIRNNIRSSKSENINPMQTQYLSMMLWKW